MELEAFNPLIPALLILSIGAIVGHILFVRLFPRSDTFWKKADYAALVIAGLGLVSVATDVREESAANYLDIARDRASFALRDIAWAIDLADSHVYCSPPWGNNDPAEAARYEAVCEWAEQAAGTLNRLTEEAVIGTEQFTKLDRGNFDDPPALITDPGTAGWEFERRVAAYNEAVQDVRRLEDQVSDNSLEQSLRFLAPFFIALGIAIELTKVSASRRHTTDP